MGAWSVILPEAATNKVLNPVAMGASYFTAIGAGTITAVTTYSYLGYKCYRLQTSSDNTGAYFTLSALANAAHYMTFRLYGYTEVTTFDCSVDNSNWTVPTYLYTEGNWGVFGISFSAAQSNASVALRFQQKGSTAVDVYIGHLQVEQNTYPTTPITGSIMGFCSDGYKWNGVAHGSSSARLAKERSGGKIVDLETSYNFRVLYGQGTGMPPIQHLVQPMALLPGSLYQGSKVLPRVIDLYSGTKATTAATVSAARRDFINAVKSDRVSPEQPVVFRYTGPNTSKPITFRAYYDSGMEFQTTSGVVDKPSARFICYDPFGYEVHTQGIALGTLQSISDADYLVRRTDGVWYNVSTNISSWVMALEKHNGILYLGGYFSNVGDTNGDFIVSWNGTALSSMGSGLEDYCRVIKKSPDGLIYVGGDFTSAGSVANTAGIAYWDPVAGDWNEIGGGITATSIEAFAFDGSGNVYVGGNFTNHGDADGDFITMWNGTAWSSIGTGANSVVYDLVIGPDGCLYIGGLFTEIDGVTVNGVAKWDGTTITALGAGITSDTIVYTLCFDDAGNLYAGGNFTTADGGAAANIAMWNGKTWLPLGSGTDDTVRRMRYSKGLLYVGGYFTTAGGLTLAEASAIWNGYTWAHLPIDLPGTPQIISWVIDGDDLYMGGTTAGTAYSSIVTQITNSGSTAAYPRIKIYRAADGANASIRYLKNEATGDTLWLNYSLVKGETLTIDFTPGDKSIKSDYFGNVWQAVLRGSDFGTFRFLPGVNNISVMVSTDATVTAWAEWPLAHWGADMVAA